MRKASILLLLTSFAVLVGCNSNNKITKSDVIETLSHQDSFTEGLFFYNGDLYESSGLNDKSFVYRYSDEYRKNFDTVFLEGSVILDEDLYLLTWKDNQACILDTKTFEIINQYGYEREGWGLTTDGSNLIASDGTSSIYYMDKEFKTIKSINIEENGKEIDNINELEYVDGFILANIWKENDIIVIDPDSGKVIKRVSVNLKSKNPSHDYLNGIAYDGTYIYLTGKYYDEIWKVSKDIFVSN